MPNILFASNNKAHWPNIVSSTLADTFDATRVPYSFKLAHMESFVSPVWVPASGEVTWIHLRTWANSNDFYDQHHLFQIFDVNENLLAKVYMYDSTNQAIKYLGVEVYDGGTSVNDRAAFVINEAIVNTIDLRYELKVGEIDTKLYINGGLVGSANLSQNNAGYANPAYMSIGSAFADTNGFQYFSEIIVADGDTRNARMNLLRPTAVGGETDWVGIATDLADDDPTSGMTSIAANQRQTLDLSAYTGAGNISALVVATQALAGANAPQNMRHTVRMSTVNYDGPTDISLGDTLKYALTDFQINPATSLPWTSADLASLEMGFVSKA